MKMWTMRLDGPGDHRWVVSDGKMQISIHQLINGGITQNHHRMIVTPEEATEYAIYILDALNACDKPIPSGAGRGTVP